MNINLIAPLNTTGYGYTGQNIAYALNNETVNVSLFPIGQVDVDENRKELVERLKANAGFYDSEAPSLRIWHQHDLAERIGRGIHIGFPFFELDSFNAREKHHLNLCDMVFVASKWAKQVVLDASLPNLESPNSVCVIPLGVDRSIFHENVQTDHLEPDHTVFINIGKWEVRKGHDFLIKAFNAAFTKTDKVLLKMLCFYPFIGYKNDEWAKLYLSSPLASKIRLMPRLTTQGLVSRFIATGDCGVFPSRAEGWNLELLEFMSMGKRVIATFATAHTEYVNGDNTKLIMVDSSEPAEDGIWFHGQGNWFSLGNDQLEQTVEHMREIHRLKQTGNLVRNESGIETAKIYSWQHTANSILQHLG